jgi:hypothetical protein
MTTTHEALREAPQIGREELRALRRLADRSANELLSNPLPILGILQARGYAYVAREYQTTRHGTARVIAISEAGRSALAAALNTQPGGENE